MPEKPVTIATYAAGASLAAITLVYVFAPTFFFDGASSSASSNARKKGVVGLSNTANDCFINSVLQSLAGVADLRLYLIRETHRRRLDEPDVYRLGGEEGKSASGKTVSEAQLRDLRAGIVTFALKEVLDSLNERPIYRKTVSAMSFVRVLERGFKQAISRQQQDAHEFLQVVAERLSEEYHAGRKARQRWRDKALAGDVAGDGLKINTLELPGASNGHSLETKREETDQDEDGFPLEGKLESQIECQTCHFKPRASVSSFVTLTLNVPQQTSTTLNSCFDGLFKTEYIEDFRCDKCRLEHALALRSAELGQMTSEKHMIVAEADISKIEQAIRDDPENPPKDLMLPDIKLAPKRKIARHVRIAAFPRVVAIHLSRSIYDARSSSRKNSAKVAFPIRLPLGGILERKQYKLLGMVTHRGSHNSGHYEAFRRQVISAPFSTPNVFAPSSIYSPTSTPLASAAPSPDLGAVQPSRPGMRTEGTTGYTSSTWSPSQSPLAPPNGRASSVATSALSGLASDRRSPSLASPVLVKPASSPSSTPPSSSTSTQREDARTLSTASSPERGRGRGRGREAEEEREKERDGFSLRSSIGSLSLRRRRKDAAPPPSAPDPTSAPRLGADPGAGPESMSLPTSNKKKKKSRRERPRKKEDDRWWRISDEVVKESSTAEVLALQREVYLLFYELER